jgi:hypothetical protein
MSMDLYRWARELKGLTRREKVVLMAIADRVNDKMGYAYPSQEKIGEDTGYHRSSVARACESLKEKGLLSWRNKRKPGGHYTSNCYFIHRVEFCDTAQNNTAVSQGDTQPCSTVKQKPLVEPKDITLSGNEGKVAFKGNGNLTQKQLVYAEKLAHKYFALYRQEHYLFDYLLSKTMAFFSSSQTDADWRGLGTGLPSPKDKGWM